MTFSDIKIGQRLAIGFGAIILLLLAIGLLGSVQIARVYTSVDAMALDQYPKTVMLNRVKGELNEIAGSMRNLLLLTTLDELGAERATIQRAGLAIGATLARLEQLPSTDEGRGLMRQLAQARAAYSPVLERFVALVADGQAEQARDLVLPEIAPHQQRYFRALDALIAYQGGLMERAGRDAKEVSRQTRWLLLALAGGAVLLALLVGRWATLSITRPLVAAVALARRVADGDLRAMVPGLAWKGAGGAAARAPLDEAAQLRLALSDMHASLVHTVGRVRSGTETLGTGLREIAAGNQDLSQRTGAQAASIEQTAAALDQLSTTVGNNAANADQVRVLVLSATHYAHQGGRAVEQVADSMSAIQRRSRSIADINGVIDGIAFQTNILALNAAVEAARAGEQGRGFAVVAAEVRNLAQRSTGSAQQIKALIDASVSEVAAGGKLVAQAGQEMQRIVQAVAQVATLMAEIAASSAEQSAGIVQVNHALAQIDVATRQNAELVQQAAAAAQGMQQEAGALATAVAVFKLAPV